MVKWIGLFLLLVVTVLFGAARAELSLPVDGVFGLKDVDNFSCLSLWVPISSSTCIGGIDWFNNDAGSVFSEVFAVAGDLDSPFSVNDATLVCSEIEGETYAWSRAVFDQPVSSSGAGILLIFIIPSSGAYQHIGEGGGCGIGFNEDAESSTPSWVSSDGINWSEIKTGATMAIDVIYETNKSNSVLILDSPYSVLDGECSSEDSSNIFDEDDLETAPNLPTFLTFPNPCNPEATIQYYLPDQGTVEVGIFDIRGHLVRSLFEGVQTKGQNSVQWDGKDDSGLNLASGLYLIRIHSEVFSHVGRITLVR